MEETFDVLIIGGGVVGCAIAREMSRYALRIGVLEKELDVAMGNSSRNSGVLHGGFTYKPGSLKARCAVEGNQEFDRVAEELGVPFRRVGKVVVGFTEKDRRSLLRFKEVGEKNGVRGLEMIDKERLNELDPSAGGEFAMYSPSSGILDPFEYTMALAENAAENGVCFYFDQEVKGAVQQKDGYLLTTQNNTYHARYVVNAAGLYSAQISEILGIPGHTIRGFKGEYYVLDKKAGEFISMAVYPAPTETGGFATHATPTVDGNVLIGPDSYVVEDFEDFTSTRTRMEALVEDGLKMFGHTKPEYFIRNFAGIRAKRVDPATGEVLDFVCERREDLAPRAINLVGIESPGLTSALPLARRAVALLKEVEELKPKASFEPRRKAIKRIRHLDWAQRKALVESEPNYGEIVCRCESISKGEILKAIHNPLGAATLTSIKNRTRATMGRCQGGYCETRITRLIMEELGLREEEVLFGKKGGFMFTGKVRS